MTMLWLLSVLKAVHLLSAVAWVGGMLFAYVVLRPSMGVLEPAGRLALHGQVFRRFFLVVWHAMPLLILTGFVMVFGIYGGMKGVRWPVHVMLSLGLLMAGVYLVLFFGPYRRFGAATDPAGKVAALESIRKLIGLNLILGLVTVALSQF